MTTLAQQFKAEWYPIITPIAQKYGLNPDFLLTQIAQESYWGQKIPVGSNNFAGITEVRKGKGVTANDNGKRRRFRQFSSKEEFADHYGSLLSRLYPGVKTAKTIEEFGSALQDGKRRYAEASHYKDALNKVFNDHFSSGYQAGDVVAQKPTTTNIGGGTLSGYSVTNKLVAPKLAITKPEEFKDPYEDLWNVKPVKNGLSEVDNKINIVSYDTGFPKSKWVNEKWGIDP